MKTYKGDYLQEIVFPLSGIGTGGVGLSGTGELVDWELYGRANKLSLNEYTHFAIKAERDGAVIDARVLTGDRTRNLSGDPCYSGHHSWGYGNGLNRATVAGMPHFEDVTFRGGFPFAEIDYASAKMPADITLTAFNPFIPGDEDNSSLPCAFFSWKIKNTSGKKTDYTLAFSVGNTFKTTDGGIDTFSKKDGISSITLTSRNYKPGDKEYGELSISTDCDDISYQEYWYRGGWFDDLTVFRREFSSYGRLKNRSYGNDDLNGRFDTGDMATLAAHISLQPGEEKTVPFVMTWYYPNFEKYWGDGAHPVWKHEYCRRFSSAADVTAYCFANYEMLYGKSKQFENAMTNTTLPGACSEAALFNLEVLKSPTCLRLENGEFWAFEGTTRTDGACEGTCDHVWGYQYALAFLFPRLARQILETDYNYNMKESGEMMFRTMLPLGSEKQEFCACVDGQMGAVIRFYREWKLSGDDEWLKKYWDSVKKSLEYAWSEENRDMWDPGKTGVITGRQHHTLDVELFGPCSWLTGYYLAALKAASEIAAYLGEKDRSEEYYSLFRKGSKFVDEELFNGRHYIQKIDLKDRNILKPFAEYDPGVYRYWNDEKKEMKYQIGDGCEIDQLVAQWHASMTGLGDILDPAHRKKAAKAIYELNFKSMRDMANPCRIFAVNDERGAVICEWAENSYKPQIPVPYTEECMTGFEYAAAQLMIGEGLVKEGTEIVDAVRERYDGKKRNPYAEIECGSSYARSMAGFSLPEVFAGYRFDMTCGKIGFKPVTDGEVKSVWFVSSAWGTFRRSDNETEIKILDGDAKLKQFELPYLTEIHKVECDGEEVSFSFDRTTEILVPGKKVCHSIVIS